MKNGGYPSFRKMCLMLCVGMILYAGVAGQCLNNLATRSYDTVLNGIGYGVYALRFPQWDPDSGTLVSVKVSARVSVQYVFTLRNVDVMSSDYTLRVGREDRFTSSAMTTAYDNIVEQQIGVYPLDPGAVYSQGPFPFLHDYVNTDSITVNTVPFLGKGLVSFMYSPVTYTDLRTDNNASFAYHATAQDAMNFSITYLYCNSQVALATGLTRWLAVLEDPATVRLDWSVASEAGGRQYEVQRSMDGRDFTTVTTLAAVGLPSGGGVPGIGGGGATAVGGGAADYGYTDHLPVGVGGKWYYRLAIHDPGHLNYSEIRVVTAGGGKERGLRVYPNPAIHFVNLVMGGGTVRGAGVTMGTVGSPGDAGDGWQVDLYTAGGGLIQRGRYPPAQVIRVDFQEKMSPGTYFARVMDLRGQHSYISSFIVMD